MPSTTAHTPYRLSPRPRIRYGAMKNDTAIAQANAAQLVAAATARGRRADTGAASGGRRRYHEMRGADKTAARGVAGPRPATPQAARSGHFFLAASAMI